MSRRVAVALVHHPVLDAQGAIVTTALTNMDVHDLSRSSRTFGCSDFFVVHPVPVQRTMVERIVEHWTHGSSAKRIPDRKEALAVARPVATLEEAEAVLGGGGPVERWVTAARVIGTSLSFPEARARLATSGPPVLIVFGTGWGLAPAVTANANVVLPPIKGPTDYNHLSVRAACAIILDRLLAPAD